MNVIMNKNMKKRMDSAIDLYFFAGGNAGSSSSFRIRITRVGGTYDNISTKFFANIRSSYTRLDWPSHKNRIELYSPVYKVDDISTFKRKFSKLVVTFNSEGATIFTDTIKMITPTETYDKKYNTDSKGVQKIVSKQFSGVCSLSSEMNTDQLGSQNASEGHEATISYPILTKTAYKNGVPYNQAKVTGTVDGNVRVSLIAPFDIPPTQTGVVLDSFQIEFFDDFDRPTAIVTGTIGDLNSTADVKMANTLIEDGAYINISGMDDFLITTPNTIAISN